MSEYENKAASGDDVAGAFDEFMRAFEDFKATNDQRLEQVEKRSASDVVTEEKLERLNRTLDQMVAKSARPPLSGGVGGTSSSVAGLAHKSAFEGYMRKGEAGNLRALEAKALSVGSDPDGGYLVPFETERAVMQSLKDISPIRAIAGIREVSGTSFKKPFSISGPGTGWVGENAARPETTSPALAELTFPTMELYAMPAATSTLLDDAAVNVDEWIAEEVRLAFAEQEGTAFVSGDGINKPKGFLSYATVDNSVWTWGNLGYVPTGVAGGFAAANPSDNLIDLVYSVKSSYRGNAHWVMNRASQAEIRKIKDANGDYIWQPGEQLGAAPTLMHFPIAESEDMPDIATDTTSIAFGDFNRGYLIVDRIGLRVLRDPYSSKPYVLFYTTKRVGGGVQDFDAIKLMKFGIA
ncbi:MAG: phage major capsid protein [Hyphomicrobiaceae bacterium]|nr:phage major capsid protein [Hyphomicrobiaceae bacterium]